MPECLRLRWRQTYGQQESVEENVTKLHAIRESPRTRMFRTYLRFQPETLFEKSSLFIVLGREIYVSPVFRQAPVGSQQPDRICKLGRPPYQCVSLGLRPRPHMH